MDAPRRRPEDFLELVERAKRGRLKVFIGSAAGVGKTYQMLEEAHALKKRGVDIVLAFIETHGRAETEALIEGLEVIPRQRVEYRGVVVEEMDVDAVLKRRPQVAVVDELAHTSLERPFPTRFLSEPTRLLTSIWRWKIYLIDCALGRSMRPIKLVGRWSTFSSRKNYRF